MNISAAILSTAALFIIPSAFAIDVPMNQNAAADVLDSKTCYSSVFVGKSLLAYELNDLLITVGGVLIRLGPTGPNTVGDRHPRRYTTAAIEVVILPRSIVRMDNNEADLSEVHETGVMTVEENGTKKTFPITVIENCSP